MSEPPENESGTDGSSEADSEPVTSDNAELKQTTLTGSLTPDEPGQTQDQDQAQDGEIDGDSIGGDVTGTHDESDGVDDVLSDDDVKENAHQSGDVEPGDGVEHDWFDPSSTDTSGEISAAATEDTVPPIDDRPCGRGFTVKEIGELYGQAVLEIGRSGVRKIKNTHISDVTGAVRFTVDEITPESSADTSEKIVAAFVYGVLLFAVLMFVHAVVTTGM